MAERPSEKLKASSQSNTKARRHDLIRELLGINLRGDTMEQYLLRVERLCAQLRALGRACTTPVVRNLIMDGLTPAYDRCGLVRLRCQKDGGDADFDLYSPLHRAHGETVCVTGTRTTGAGEAQPLAHTCRGVAQRAAGNCSIVALLTRMPSSSST